MKTLKTLLMASLVCLAPLLFCGCTSSQKYIEGSTLQFGAYIPWESNIYGVEIVNWLNGCKVSSSTNQPLAITREYCASNSYLWGAVQLNENTKTTVDVKKEIKGDH